MDNLRKSIELLFGVVNTETILAEIENTSLTIFPFRNGLKDEFVELGRTSLPYYTKDEWRNIVQKLEEDWMLDVRIPDKRRSSLFNLLPHFTIQALKVKGNVPQVKEDYLLRWRELTHTLGEDLFTCSHLGYVKAKNNSSTSFFAWPTVVTYENIDLRTLLNEGVSENHFHLKGSAPIFELSWISLMNNLNNRQDEFRKLVKDNRQIVKQLSSFNANEMSLENQVILAGIWRKELFKFLNGRTTDVNQIYGQIESCEFRMLIKNHQAEIESLKRIYGLKFTCFDKETIPDYAIPLDIEDSNLKSNVLLCGERKFLIECFEKIYCSDKEFARYSNIFYSYLVIKNKLREELIQVNRKVGFTNFSDYQDRKEYFISKRSIFETAFLSMAVRDTSINQKILSFETRVAPKSTSIRQKESIQEYDRSIQSTFFKKKTAQEKIDELVSPPTEVSFPNFYVLHFIKAKDLLKVSNEYEKIINTITPRDNELRKKVKKEAHALVNLKESASVVANRILGIDAAASELDSRPEVFAQAFRFLKSNEFTGKMDHLKSVLKEQKLMATYHVGEEFLDIVDGMRAIDEAIIYLNLTKGDRLGHALALGIEVEAFYNFKCRKLMLPKHDILDNTVWLLAKIKEYEIEGLECEIETLENRFSQLFQDIYFSNFYLEESKSYGWVEFWEAWKLRGDDPKCYLNLNVVSPQLSTWDRFRFNSLNKKGSNKLTADAEFLYHSYHFNPEVQIAGEKIAQFIISSDYVNLVKLVQDKFLREVSEKELAIECNPSSNYLIGTIQKFADHPIKRFFSEGLTSGEDEFVRPIQTLVSINTDDQGVFGTTLENEYALMYKALQKEVDDKGKQIYKDEMIIDWLDKIRVMGNEMSFKS